MADKSRFGSELTEAKINALVNNATPSNTKKVTKFGMKIFNGTYLIFLMHMSLLLLYWEHLFCNFFSSCVLFINTDISVNFLHLLGSPGGSKFSTRIEDVGMEELSGCLKSFYTSARKQDVSFYKKTSLKSIRAAMDCFLCSPPRSKQFSITSHAAFTEVNKVLDAFIKDLWKSGKIAGLVHKKAIAKQQIQKLVDCGELGLADTKTPAQLQRPTWFYLGLFFGNENVKWSLECLPSDKHPTESTALNWTGIVLVCYHQQKIIRVALQILRTNLTQRFCFSRISKMSC